MRRLNRLQSKYTSSPFTPVLDALGFAISLETLSHYSCMLTNGKDKPPVYRIDEMLLTLAIGIVTTTDGPFESAGF